MGFMAGFGEGFTRSFERARQNRADKERDLFKVAYDSYIEKKDSYAKSEAAWKSAMSRGEILAQKYGQGPEVAMKAADWLYKGMSESEVDNMMANSTFEVPTASETNPTVDQQMTQFGVEPPANPVTMPFPAPQQQAEQPTNVQTPNPMVDAQPLPQNNDLLGNMFGPDGIFKNAGKSDMEQARGDVLQQTGTTEQQMAQYEGGFTPPTIPDVKWKYTDPNGKGVQTPLERTLGKFGIEGGATEAKVASINAAAALWSKSADAKERALAAEWEAIRPLIELQLKKDIDPEVMKLLSPMNETFGKFATQKADTIAFISQIHELSELGSKLDGIALNPVGGVVAGFEGLKNILMSTLQVAGEAASQGVLGENEVINSLTQELTKDLNTAGYTEEVAYVANQYASALIRAAYASGKMQGQQGNGFSNNDFVNNLKSIQSGSSFKSFNDNLVRYANDGMRSVATTAKINKQLPAVLYLNSNPDTSQYMQEIFTPVESYLDQSTLDWLDGKSTQQLTESNSIQSVDPSTGDIWVFRGNPETDSIEDMTKWVKLGPSKRRSE